MNHTAKEQGEYLFNIAFRAIDAQKAKAAAASAKCEYHTAWQRFEIGMEEDDGIIGCPFAVEPSERITASHARFEDACDATKIQYNAYIDAKRAAYNAQRRLETAIKAVK